MSKNIYFGCFKGVSWQSHLIRFWTRSQYSHIAYIVDIKNMLIIEPVRNGRWGKVLLIETHTPGTVIEVYSKSVPNEQAKIVDDFMQKLAINKTKYDWRGILGFVLKIDDNKKKYFCSEGCCQALIEAGTWPKLYTGRVHPGYFTDLLRVSGFNLYGEYFITKERKLVLL